MTAPSLLERERTLVRGLVQLAADRARAERDTAGSFQSRNEAADRDFDETKKKLTADYEAEQQTLNAEYEKVRQGNASRYEAEQSAADKESSLTRNKVKQNHADGGEQAETEHGEARWTATTVLEADKTKCEARRQELQRKLDGQQDKINATRSDAGKLFERWRRQPPDQLAESANAPRPGELLQQLQELITSAEDQLAQARKSIVLKVLQGNRIYGLLALVWLVCLVPAAMSAARTPWLIAGTVVALIVDAGLYSWLNLTARGQVRRVYWPLATTLSDAEQLCTRCKKEVEIAAQRAVGKAQEKHDAEQRQVEERFQKKLKFLQDRHDNELKTSEERHRKRSTEAQERRDQVTRQADERYPRLLAESLERYDMGTRQADERHRRLLEESRATQEADWKNLETNWKDGLAHAQEEAAAINRESERVFPAWKSNAWREWQPPAKIPKSIRFGEFTLRMDAIPEGVPQDPRLREGMPESFTLPALFPFPDPTSLSSTSEEGLIEADATVEAVIFRMLTAVPPSKVRFTIIDPVNLGRHFSAFMHLADYDEALVNSRIWTEQQHIDQRLADLLAHIENVIQRFLRNQYKDIEEYNANAGEVAEAFRVLVVSNFPHGFSVEAARRLASIISSGARCGVSALITVDEGRPMPHGFSLDELRKAGAYLMRSNGKFEWGDPDLGKYPFRLDAPPDPDFMTRILNIVGREAKLANRVEVPFEFIAPPAERWWTVQSSALVDVPLGRSGATKRQHMQLGKGTAQHVLVAGKTGSGKSTLLHALITNAALLYSPEEIEMYLIDFKEGVEFKPYATYALPHARVVAVESEREFGLSVLQRLEGELKARGDTFRKLGVQDINAYRQVAGTKPLPRVLLIVDEFQLFFVEDDKIAQDAALLLDRLVRQGRAFGIHVLLGSQTLGGAYSLARSTIGQMAVRIALQCSESDANLILADDNPAARLLSRPGEAIYNDANGLAEGNDFFQVVWLPEDRRVQYLKRLHDMAEKRNLLPAQPQIVFEGNAPADIHKNDQLNALITAANYPTEVRASYAWLGEAMAIKDPTAAVFRPQSGGNAIMVGQQDENALAVMAMTAISLATQHPPEPRDASPAQFYVLDGTPADGRHVGYWSKLAEALPHAVKVAGWRELTPVLKDISNEVTRRHSSPDARSHDIFVLLYGLQRFRDLRQQEEDYSFARRGEEKPVSPSKLFGNILREGPAVGVYLLIWCDSLNNVNRAFDRATLREFEMRILFQMSATDSSNLIDTPAASRLNLYRALYFSEERGQPEKFRPYALPTDDYLAWVKEQLTKKPVPRRKAAPPPAAVAAKGDGQGDGNSHADAAPKAELRTSAPEGDRPVS
jgi:hypothetical protein